ncbi:MAG: 50S ribosomal protein L13 [Rickettsiaceae bacterium H1]|nr:50S ribosomal protein L13 [Rickettsiaceae bacterium H1]
MYSSYSQKKSEIRKNWLLINAKGAIVGRLAAKIAILLRGKNKPTYTPHMDGGDCVVVINAAEVAFSGKKIKNKIYYRHTGYPGGIKSTIPEKILDGKYPERVLKLAVKRMLDNGPMARKRMKNLYVYSGSEHKHEAQKPQVFDFISLNKKNKVN